MEGDTLEERWLEDEPWLEDDALLFDIESEDDIEIENDIESKDDTEGENDIESEDDIQDKENGYIIEPKCGMVFPSYDAVYEFWKAYGTAKGFPVRKRSSTQKDGKKHYITIMCSLGGKSTSCKKNPSKLQPHTRLGCPVKLTGSLGIDGQWRITKLFLEHNHLLSPSKARYFPCNRIIPSPIRRRLELNDRSGIRVNKNVNACIDEAGGLENATFTPKDARNQVDKTRHLRLGEGDAMAIQDYFLNMQASNPGFRFSIDIDPIEGRLQNVFWADTRSIEAYKEFGRVITFDTTYLVNRYDMPFAPFVGVNHHGQSVLLGCGLISSEDTETFCWLCRTWLKCMSGVAPEGIITDQDKAMQNAIKIVFPNTRHRWCLWHITSKFPKKFVGYKNKLEIIYHLQKAIYDSQKPLEFEQSWSSMLEKYDLHENDWLSGLYDERQRWIPCFVKSSYWAGMSTTQRSESINAFFDGYVNAKTTLKQFVEQYGNALRSKVEKETEADYRSITQLMDLVTHWAMEKQFQSVYTLSKFKEFQNEVKGKQYCGLVSTKECDWGLEWVIVEDMIVGDGIPRRVNFTILMSESHDGCDLKCSCHLFEFKGILCRHAMYVFLTTYGNVNLPEKYIFDTWRKDVKRCHSRVKITYDGWVGTAEQKRYDELCTLFTKVAIMGSEDDDKRKEVVDFLDGLKDHLSSLQPNASVQPAYVQPAYSSDQPKLMNDHSQVILDPVCKRGKGRPPENRKMSVFEKIARRIRKSALKNSETSFSKASPTKTKQARGKKKNAVEASQNKLPSVSQVCEQTPTQKSMPLSTQEYMSDSSNTQLYTQESIALGGHPTNEMSYSIPQAYMGERGFPYGINMNLSLGVTPQISQNPFWYNMYNAPTGYDPSAYVQPLGYASNVQQRMQQPPPTSATYPRNNM